MPDRAYKIAEQKPVARFWYKGHHTHPLLKVGLVIDERTSRDIVTMYMLRDGKTVYQIGKGPIKSFRRDRMARNLSLRAEVRRRLGIGPDEMNCKTFVRHDLTELVRTGV